MSSLYTPGQPELIFPVKANYILVLLLLAAKDLQGKRVYEHTYVCFHAREFESIGSTLFKSPFVT